jgi:hypothetical protein
MPRTRGRLLAYCQSLQGFIEDNIRSDTGTIALGDMNFEYVATSIGFATAYDMFSNYDIWH